MHCLARQPICLFIAFAAASSALAAVPAGSYLVPSKHEAAIGDVLTLRFDAGAAKDAQPAPWPAAGVPWLFVRGGPTQENRHDVRPARSADNFTSVTIEHPGVTLIGANPAPTIAEVSADEWRACLALNTGETASRGTSPADRPVRVRHVVSTKTLVRVAAEDGRRTPSAIATSKSGQVVEIRPHFDPTAAQPGGDIPLTFYVDGDKRPAAKVRATNVATGKAEEFVTDGGGSGHFRITDAGAWRVEAHFAQPLESDPSADWVIYTATLTFEIAAGGAKGGAQ
ncbi:MAG TPA: DUF4198 domain-containing protein [Phycisphaerae bacterium]|nr:DUF4198 domain-containing protein [Phycisphaerae bacterium]HQL53313.1 DUF4198 domain-containing protein [Phycisphaerae bacterium]